MRMLISQGPFQVNESVLCALNIPYIEDKYGNCNAEISPTDERIIAFADRWGIENISGTRNTFRIVTIERKVQ